VTAYIRSPGDPAPTADVFDGIEVVLYFNEYTIADDSEDLVADFFDAGGRVVSTIGISLDGFSSAGKWTTGNYLPVAAGANLVATEAALGEVLLPDHPVLNGVDSLTSDFSSNIVPIEGATVVAQLDNGFPAIVSHVVSGRTVFYLNIIPRGSYVSGDAFQLVENALLFK
jgi:hypothetical protein